MIGKYFIAIVDNLGTRQSIQLVSVLDRYKSKVTDEIYDEDGQVSFVNTHELRYIVASVNTGLVSEIYSGSLYFYVGDDERSLDLEYVKACELEVWKVLKSTFLKDKKTFSKILRTTQEYALHYNKMISLGYSPEEANKHAEEVINKNTKKR